MYAINLCHLLQSNTVPETKLKTITWYPEKETAQGEEESYIASI